MRRCCSTISFAALALVLGASLPAAAQTVPDALRLRNWHVGLQGVSTWRSDHDVFGRPELPGGIVEERGRGAGVFLGRRFGERFLLDLQLAGGAHGMEESDDEILAVEALLTGTVLFRHRDTFQPFLRGGFGGGGSLLDLAGTGGEVLSFGTAAIAGGGCQVRLSSRFSLEWELVATFNNFLEVHDNSTGDHGPQDTWQVRVSNWGWRSGTGVVFWF